MECSLWGLSEKEYFVRGSTALLDAVGRTIDKIIRATRNTKKDYQGDKVMFVIITDGMENDSREYDYEGIKAMIERQKENYGWEFVFLGANIDAISTAARFGIEEDRAANYNADSRGTQLNYEAVSEMIVKLRTENKVSDNWKESIDRDYKERGERK